MWENQIRRGRNNADAGYAKYHAGRQRRGNGRRDDPRALASPQLVIFFEKFPRLKNAVPPISRAGGEGATQPS